MNKKAFSDTDILDVIKIAGLIGLIYIIIKSLSSMF